MDYTETTADLKEYLEAAAESVASMTDLTGLIPSLPQSADENAAYAELAGLPEEGEEHD